MKKYNIGGKKRPIQFGLGAISAFCDLSGGDIELIDEIFTSTGIRQLELVRNIVYAGLLNACEIGVKGVKIDVDFNPALVQLWIDDMDQDELTKILSDFKDSKLMGKTIASYYEVQQEEETDSSESKKK